ncbi:hypothetical protein ACQPZX_30140 [Actinoplanes sp. CA-142083]|uniref:hypothetical protein n=1 Tax=Actinoplanes sp. CA-142083 TaxID=3239903 RepID=UPI003D90007C
MAATLHALLFAPAPGEDLAVVATGLVLLPLTPAIVESVMDGPGETFVPGFYDLGVNVAEWARQRSKGGPVAYVHCEFFGGHGFHAAMGWRGGEAAWGPSFTATAAGEAEDHYVVAPPRPDRAINAVLRWLGVDRGAAIDEFAAAGLDRFRSTEDWVST